MITDITSIGFKSLTFSHKLKQHNLVFGPMGVGKSAISDSIILAINGYIPGSGKTNQAIMDAYSGNGKLFIKVHFGESSFERRFIKNAKGKVSQKFRINETNATKDKFISEFSIAGKPTILNLDAFLALSDQKKIDTLFELYPPKGDLAKINDQIETADLKLKRLQATMGKKEGIIESLTADLAEIELPSGTLAEITHEIEKTTAAYNLAQDNLKRQEIKDAEQKAAGEPKDDTERMRRDAGLSYEEKPKSINELVEEEESRPSLCGDPGYTARNSEEFQKDATAEQPKYGTKEYAGARVEGSKKTITDPKESIKNIIEVMEKAGCTACAAKLVAKRELRKF